MAHAGHGLDFVEVRAHTLPCVHGTLVIDGIQHAGDFEVDAVERFAGDDAEVVDAGGGTSDDFVILGILELDGFEIGGRKHRGFFRERAVSECALCELMNDVTGRSRALRFGDGPGLRGGRDKHLPACSAYAAKWIPIDGRGRAPAGALRAVLGFFKVGLLDAHVFPIDVKLLGDEHGQTRFDALTNLRILGHDGDEIVGSNTDKSERLKCGRGRLGRGSLSGRSKGFSGGLKMIGEKKTTTGKGGCFEKSATIEESRVHGASSGDRRGSRGLRRLPRRSIVNPNSVLGDG